MRKRFVKRSFRRGRRSFSGRRSFKRGRRLKRYGSSRGGIRL